MMKPKPSPPPRRPRPAARVAPKVALVVLVEQPAAWAERPVGLVVPRAELAERPVEPVAWLVALVAAQPAPADDPRCGGASGSLRDTDLDGDPDER